MTDRIYPLWKQAAMNGAANADLDNDTATDGLFCALVDTSVYTYNDSHQFYTDLSGIVGTDQRITTPTISASGILDGGDLIYTSAVGASAEALVIYRRNSGLPATWRLVSYYDSPGGGLPVTPNGANITVTWNSAGIFQL